MTRLAMKYWIQRADFSAQDLEAGSVDELCTAFERHDWAAEEELRQSLDAAGREWCQPGFGVVGTDDERLLHICPHGEGLAQFHYHHPESRRVLGLFPTRRRAQGTWDGQVVRARKAIELFSAGRHQELIDFLRRGD